MTLQKQPIAINFAQGLDTKTDPFQIPIGKFAALTNSVFNKGGLLTKRNGFASLPPLPDATSTYVTTFNDDLTAIGNSLEAYSTSTMSWYNKGKIQPLTLDVMPLIRNNLNQIQADAVIAPNGLICTVYTEVNNTTNSYKYVIADSVTGQNIIAPTVISGAHATLGTPKVFLSTNYFIIVYTSTVPNLAFIAVSINSPTTVTAAANVSTSYTPAASVAFDGVVLGGTLFLAWNGAAASGLKMARIFQNLTVSATVIEDAAHVATVVSVCADVQNSVVWASYYDSAAATGYALAVDTQLNRLATFPVQIIAAGVILNLASAAQSGVMTVFYETSNTASGIQTNFITSKTVTQSSGAVGSAIIVLRSVGLASKAFIIDNVIYFMAAYSSTYQPTYFIVNGSTSTSAAPVVIAKLAYQNGGGYMATGLPNVTVTDQTFQIAYLFKDLVQALTDSNAAGTTVNAAVYSQTGINLATFVLGADGLMTAEIGKNLNITGGFLQAYDGYIPVEHNFHLWPDSVQVSTATGAGAISAQTYFYVVTYEWTDNQGNAFRSAASVPVTQVTSTASSTNTLIIPTLRVTAKVANPVKIVIYRWSTGQPVFHQVTSITAPTLNSTTTDSVTYADTLADSSIVGNNILYTTGGVIEDTGAPASAALALFDDRLWLIDAEDPNLLWFSKQVIEGTPVEMSDLLTKFIAPTIGAQGSTGPMKCLGAMDDKLIIFKQDAIYYINGSGPDNTGANNQYSEPIFVASSVGCANQKSIVLSPKGLIFESDKGKWLLGRDLSTTYIGAPVDDFNDLVTSSAVGIPGTNQDRLTSADGTALMYDYYYDQWGTFSNVPAVSSTLFEGAHTYISGGGQVFQETPDTYLDGTRPVLLSFQTGWLNLAGIRGYQRAYCFYLLGQYLSPFRLVCSIGYDYNADPIHSAIIDPTNFAPTYGGTESNGQDTVYGSDTPYGGNSKVLNWRVFLKKQRCSALQIKIQEVYDPSFGVAAGAGLSLSGLSVICAVKSGFKTISSKHSVGAK